MFFNSKQTSALSVERQLTKFPVASKYSCNHKDRFFRVKTPTPFACLTYNFATALKETTTYNLKTLTTRLLLTPSFQNCELKQEPCTLATAFRQPLKFHNRERRYFFTFVGWVGCSEIAAFGANFCLINRASALKVSENEQNFLLRQNSCNRRIGLESKHHHLKIVNQTKRKIIICFLPKIIYHINKQEISECGQK